MAEDDDDAFTFGEFNFAPFPSQPQINGITSTSKYDDVWSDFFINPSPPPSSPIQPQSNPSNWDKPTSIGADPTPFKSSNPKTGALPLSLFGEVEEEDDDHGSSGNTNGWFNPNPSSQIKKVGVFNDNKNNVVIKSGDGLSLNLDGVGPDLIVDNNIMKNNDDEDDEWGAFSGHGIVEQGNFKEQGGSILSEFGIGFSGMIEQEKQAGQDASNSVDHEPGVISFTPQSIDFFAASNWNGANHLFSETDVDNKSTANTTNGFMWDPFPAAEDIGNGNGMDANLMNQDDDDFGDFIDASREVGTKEQDQVGAHMSPAEVQLPNGEVQEKQTQTRQSRGALPLSLFSDDTEESSDCLNLQNVGVVHIPTLNPVNSFGDKGSVVSINDLISNLYSQAQVTSSDKSSVKPEYEVQSPPKVTIPTPLEGNDDWDDGSWEYQGAISENEIGEHLSAAVPVYLATKQSEILPDLKIYIDFYDQLRESLCFHLSRQLDELKKAQISDAHNGGKVEALDDEILEASKLLKESVISKEVLTKKDLEGSNFLNKFLEVLQGAEFNVIEAEYSLSTRLQLAINEWRVAAELLRHAISMLKILSLLSIDEQSLFVSAWSKIINVCVQELRHGVSVWKRASEENVQHQILSDSRGQQFFQALGEIYKVVELLGLSAKVYRPWILLSVSDHSQFWSTLFECDALWENSGLEGALQSLSDNVDFRCKETMKALVASIKKIRDIDVVAVHDRVFFELSSICQLSLLPQEMMADVKIVVWGERAYFLNLANLWANLISSNPPQLPNLQFS